MPRNLESPRIGVRQRLIKIKRRKNLKNDADIYSSGENIFRLKMVQKNAGQNIFLL